MIRKDRMNKVRSWMTAWTSRSGKIANKGKAMFSKDLELTIGQCHKEAREQRHEFMTVEHLLLALLENPSAAAVLRAVAPIPAARQGPQGDHLKPFRCCRPATSAIRSRRWDSSVLQRAVYHVQSSGRKEVTGANAGCDLRREGFARRLFPEPAGSQPPRRGQSSRWRGHRSGTRPARRRRGQGS